MLANRDVFYQEASLLGFSLPSSCSAFKMLISLFFNLNLRENRYLDCPFFFFPI